ncbi:VirB3 family type IV secretion system protein [Helicobacter ganmani]|uniref:VirB3 type IV secretion protein n=1 Tax=Helicobacter ganmani TaxID=60246 RepID=A0A3D8IHG7_9HELI|nr:VirB3 family type IV secretion system protein [Helicobacter ganmani]RDU64573.1 hypothetical protein CQA43_01900 [Helicobacter ganmani]
MLNSFCYRELTKKPKAKGLSITSWTIWAFISFILWFLFQLYAIPVAIIILALLYTLEFFDEDIYDVIKMRFKIKSKKYFA